MDQNIFNIKDKVILITGGTGVLGSSMAKAVTNAGAKVALVGRDEAISKSLKQDLEAQGADVLNYMADVLKPEEMDSVKTDVLQKWGKVDVLVNAAGGNMPGATVAEEGSINDLSIEELRKVMELNYLGSVIPSQAMLETFITQRSGHIINISSMSAQRPLTRVMGYSSSKAAIDNYTQWLAVELARKYGEGLRVNAIAPGFFLTKQNKTLLTNPDGTLTDRGKTIIAHTPYGRFGDPDELTGTLIWLCSDASKFVTGTIIPVDGGFNAYSGV
ncbi:MAG: SDR family oxidoreductase [Bacteroidota bacterium]